MDSPQIPDQNPVTQPAAPEPPAGVDMQTAPKRRSFDFTWKSLVFLFIIGVGIGIIGTSIVSSSRSVQPASTPTPTETPMASPSSSMAPSPTANVGATSSPMHTTSPTRSVTPTRIPTLQPTATMRPSPTPTPTPIMTGNMELRAKRRDGNPASQSAVDIGYPGGSAKRFFADSSGYLVVAELKPGYYTIDVYYEGTKTSTTFSIGADQITGVNLTVPIPPYASEITPTATPAP